MKTLTRIDLTKLSKKELVECKEASNYTKLPLVKIIRRVYLEGWSVEDIYNAKEDFEESLRQEYESELIPQEGDYDYE